MPHATDRGPPGNFRLTNMSNCSQRMDRFRHWIRQSVCQSDNQSERYIRDISVQLYFILDYPIICKSNHPLNVSDKNCSILGSGYT